MTTKPDSPPAKPIWAYAYQILPPQPAERLRGIKTLLDHAHADAERGARTWSGKVVLEERITHILIVSDSPEQNHEVNLALEAKLRELKAGYSVTVPLAVEASPVVPGE
jgi:hypothetical protein